MQQMKTQLNLVMLNEQKAQNQSISKKNIMLFFQRFLLISLTLIVSCISQTPNYQLKPTLELVDDVVFEFEGMEYNYSKADSILSNYKLSIPEKYMDSIRIELIAHKNTVEVGTIVKIKNSLRSLLYSYCSPTFIRCFDMDIDCRVYKGRQ